MQALYAFCSLLSQLLEDREDLRLQFNGRVQERQKYGRHPTSDPSRLKELLIDLVAKLQEPTFIIIDALDECCPRDWGALLEFLEQVCSPTTSTRVLTSARAASDLDQSEDLVPRGAVPIRSWKLPPPQRDQKDRSLAQFLVTDYMPRSVSEEVRRLLVEKLTSEMDGCAIWARMTLEDLVHGSPRLASPHHFRSYLEKYPLATPLPELCLRIFKNVTGGEAGKHECKSLLARSLELVAAARGTPITRMRHRRTRRRQSGRITTSTRRRSTACRPPWSPPPNAGEIHHCRKRVRVRHWCHAWCMVRRPPWMHPRARG